MKNIWSDQQLMAAVQAEKAAIQNKRAAEYYKAGNPELAIHHALFTVSQINHDTECAQETNEYCFNATMDESSKRG
jgi:hypothetical protein